MIHDPKLPEMNFEITVFVQQHKTDTWRKKLNDDKSINTYTPRKIYTGQATEGLPKHKTAP